MSSTSFSPGLLVVHLAGVIAVSQVIFCGNKNYLDFYHNHNATGILHEAFDKLSILLPVSKYLVDPGTLLQVSIYLIAVLYAFYLARKLYKLLFGRMNRYCPEARLGYEFPGERIAKGLVSKPEVVNEVRRRKRIGELPPVYPNGWFCLIRSEELAVGTSTSVNALGENFAIFRDEEGKVHILDAYCAHLGANLGVGGKVTGKCVECPFHGWQYDGETGHCVKIPYSNGKIPSQAKVKVWPSLEVNGLILVWYNAEGEDPSWFPEQFETIKKKRWSYHGYSTHLINAHIEDIPENGADIAHLNYVHGSGISSGSVVDYKELLLGKLHTHEWFGKWEALPAPTSHVGRLTLTMTNSFLGIRTNALNFSVVADQHGPGVVYLTYKTIFGSGAFIQCLTPQEPLLQRYTLVAYADWWIPSFVSKLMVKGFDIQLERDMLAWNNKRYKLKPLLVKEDELIVKHRRWFSQFYSENSPRFSFKKEDSSLAF